MTEANALKFRGGAHFPEESARSFFDANGMYVEILDEMEDWNDSELGDLLVGTTKVSNKYTKNVNPGSLFDTHTVYIC